MKRFLAARSRRERVLLLVFITASALVWLTSAAGRMSDRWREHRRLTVESEGQAVWLDQREAIEGRAAQAAANLDPAKTMEATELVGEVTAMAERAKLNPAVDPPKTERSGQFAYHTVQVSMRRAELGALVDFYRELAARAPYLALQECSLTAARSNPAELDATFVIFSVEVLR